MLEPRPLEVTSYRQKVYTCSLLALHAICQSLKVMQVIHNLFFFLTTSDGMGGGRQSFMVEVFEAQISNETH